MVGTYQDSDQQNLLFRFNQWLLIAILFWAPIPLGSNRDWSAALLIFLISFSGLLWSLERLKKTQNTALLPRQSLILFSLLILTQLWIGIQWMLNIQFDPAQHFQYLMLGIAYSLFFILLIAHFAQRRALTLLITVLMIIGALQAFIGAAAILGVIEPLFESIKLSTSATGTYINRNHFAGYLVMTISLAIGLLLALRDGRDWSWRNFIELLLSHKMQIRLALVIMVIGLVMSHSRMGNAAFMIALTVIGALFILKTAQNRLRNSLLLLSFVAIDVIIISQFFGLEQLKERLMHTEVTVSQQEGKLLVDINDLRSPINQRGFELLQQSPITGLGAGSYETAFIPLAGPNFGGRVDHAHNDYLEFWIEYGLIGILPLAAFVLGALWLALKALRHQRSYYRSGIGFGSAMAIVGILIHSLSDFNLHIPANALTFIAVCAIAVLALTHQNPRHSG